MAAATSAVTVVAKTVEGNHKKVYGLITLTGDYETGGVATTLAALSDNYFTGSTAFVVFNLANVDSEGMMIPSYNADLTKIQLFAPGGAGAHTHTTTVAAGTLDDAIGFESGAITSTSGGTITTNASTATVTGASELPATTTVTDTVFAFCAVDVNFA